MENDGARGSRWRRALRLQQDKRRPNKLWSEWGIDPADRFYYVWLQTMIVPIVYNWVVVILRTCFTAIALELLPVWLMLDYLSDFMYAMDIVVNLHTGFMEQGILIKDQARLRKRYLCSKRFLLDLASLLPTDLLYFVFGFRTPLVRFNRLLRVPRLNEALDRMETRTSHPNLFRITKLMIYIFVLIHWNGCLYFSLSGYIGFGRDPWVYPDVDNSTFGSPRRQYFYCFWFSAQIFTTVGDTPLPDTEVEYLFMIADLLIAVLVFASIVGNVGNIISSLRDRDNVFFPNHELVKAYLRSHHVSKELRQRIDDWYQHVQINKKIMRESEILQLLPLHMRTEIAVSVHLPTLSKVTIFQSCEKSLLEELVLKLTPQVFSPGEYVCRKGDVGHEMYIIREGKLAVVADDGMTEFAVLGAGNFFGEISILNIKGNKSGNRRTANIRSIGYSDLFSLSKEDLTEVLSEFPAAKRHLEEKGRQILTKMGMLEESEEAEREEEKTEDKVKRLESRSEELRTKLARLMTELESSDRRLKVRVERLEEEVHALRRATAEEQKEENKERGEAAGEEWEREREEAEGEAGQYDGETEEVSKEGDGESAKMERLVVGDKREGLEEKGGDDGAMEEKPDDRPRKGDGAETESDDEEETKTQ